MKIRIKGNSIRFRLTRSELARFAEEGYIETTTAFVSGTLVCALENRPDFYGRELTADFQQNIITLYMPDCIAREWINTSKTGFSTHMDIDDGEKLYLVLEKDFISIHDAVEDTNGSVENPLAYKHN